MTGGAGGDTYNQFSGSAQVVVQARTIVGGVHVRVERQLPPVSTRAFVGWLIVSAIPLSGAAYAGHYALLHLTTVWGQIWLGAAVLAVLMAIRIWTVMWQWWVLSREQQSDILVRRLSQAARGLAATLREQWRDEERLRRLQDPHPLPVGWVNADAGLMDTWDHVRRGDDGDDSGAPLELAGTLEGIVETFERIPSRRLVVLGPAGAGKTVLAWRFASRRLERDPGRIPVILPLASWHPDQSLIGWVATRLAGEHPAVGRRMLSGRTVAEELLRGDRLLPVFDGFDEIAAPLRAAALRRLNQAYGPDDPCCSPAGRNSIGRRSRMQVWCSPRLRWWRYGRWTSVWSRSIC
jgi:hypothetical protein